jgi:hypothetical protein
MSILNRRHSFYRIGNIRFTAAMEIKRLKPRLPVTYLLNSVGRHPASPFVAERWRGEIAHLLKRVPAAVG